MSAQDLAALDELDADGAPVLDQHARRMHFRLQRQVFSLQGRLEICGRGRGAATVADGVLAARKAFGVARAVVRDLGIARGPARLDPGVIDRIELARPFDADRTIAAANVALAFGPGLQPFEVGNHIRIGPAARALLRPTVVVAAVAARETGDVDR